MLTAKCIRRDEKQFGPGDYVSGLYRNHNGNLQMGSGAVATVLDKRTIVVHCDGLQTMDVSHIREYRE